MIRGRGGNIAVSSGADGIFIVDNDMPPMSAGVEKAIRGIQNEPVNALPDRFAVCLVATAQI